MKIGVHTQVLTQKPLNGIGYYLYYLLEELGRVDVQNEYFLISSHPLAYVPPGKNLHSIPSSRKAPKRFLSYFGYPKTVREEKYDLAFLPKEVVPPFINVPTVITAFDFFFLKLPQEVKKEVPWKASVHCFLAHRFHLKRATKILAISEDTKKDLINICNIQPEKIVVTPLGVNPSFYELLPKEHILSVQEKYGINRPYFFNSSSVWWFRKNLVRLIQSFANLKKRRSLPHQLVIVGKPSSSLPEMLDVVRRENLSDEVKLLQYIPREDLTALLQGATALAFPSMHEGFGFPVLEAMAARCPVITSRGSALEEVSSDAALLVDPYSTDSIEYAMEKIIDDEQLKKDLIQKGLIRAKEFTWKTTAERTLAAFQELISE